MAPAEVAYTVLALIFLACALGISGYRYFKKKTHVSALHGVSGGGTVEIANVIIADHAGERRSVERVHGQAGRFSSAHSVDSAIQGFDGAEGGGGSAVGKGVHGGSAYGGSAFSGGAHGPSIGELLDLAKLAQHESRLKEEGYEEVDDLVDATNADLIACGLKKPEVQRLRRYLKGGVSLESRRRVEEI